MKSLVNSIAILGLVCAMLSGCAVNRATANLDPAVDLARIKSMYVKKVPEDDGTTLALITEKLKGKGVAITSGTGVPPGNVDAVVTYLEKWMWDITMYMLELTITIRDPNSDFPLATGNSYHTSLTRLSAKEMVNEVLENIYKGSTK